MPISDFTYSAYRNMVSMIRSCGYNITGYADRSDSGKKCILRHDIDFDLEKALKIAEIENELNVRSTYFVLIKTNFYNPASSESVKMLKRIINLGHQVGLHFDELSYEPASINVPSAIQKEALILSNIIDEKIHVVSMHRPSKQTLAADYTLDGIENSYSKLYFEQFKYISDSRRRWRENAEEVITSGEYERLHILTHPFWYDDKLGNTRNDLLKYVIKAKHERYNFIKSNFTNLDEYISEDEI